MLSITIPAREMYDEASQQFVNTKETKLQLEHSLISISKWEAKWKIPFLKEDPPKTYEQSIDYVRCMTITQNIDPMVYYGIDKPTMDKINEYIEDKQTATWFSDLKGKTTSVNRETTTSELIYYWMIASNIPFECQKWHINRLLTLIEVCSRKNSPPKKMPRSEMLAQRAALNAERLSKTGGKG